MRVKASSENDPLGRRRDDEHHCVFVNTVGSDSCCLSGWTSGFEVGPCLSRGPADRDPRHQRAKDDRLGAGRLATSQDAGRVTRRGAFPLCPCALASTRPTTLLSSVACHVGPPKWVMMSLPWSLYRFARGATNPQPKPPGVALQRVNLDAGL